MSIQDYNMDHRILKECLEEPFHAASKWKAKYLACQAEHCGGNFPEYTLQSELFIVICLDGAPERRQNGDSWSVDCEMKFRAMVMQAAETMQHSSFQNVFPSFWNDGYILGCDNWGSARNIGLRVGSMCRTTNRQENLPWNRQPHIRAAVGKTISAALAGLAQTLMGHILSTRSVYAYDRTESAESW